MREDRKVAEETKRTIQDWVTHITELSRSKVPPPEYFRELLDGVVRTLAARGGVIWLLDYGKLRVQYHTGLESVGISENILREPDHVQLVETILATGTASSTPPRSASQIVQSQGNPTDFLVLLCPLIHAYEPRGVVEVF
jgi:hypothetical protein